VYSLTGQNILITGASGFLGKHLRRRLESLDVELHLVSRREQSSSRPNTCWWQGDCADNHFVQNVVKQVRPAVIFHLAGNATGQRELKFVLPTYHDNLTATINVLTAATENGVSRIVLAGSLEEPSAEEEVIPSSPYAAAKWGCSTYARMFHALYGTPVVIPRIFMTYGPLVENRKKLVPYVIQSFLHDEAPMLSNGDRFIDWIYVEDVIDGLVRMAAIQGIEGETFDLGSGVLISIRDLVARIARLTQASVAPVFGALPQRQMEQERVADVAKTSARLAWEPRVGLEEGLSQTIEWMKNSLASDVPDQEVSANSRG
jgi:UDP-glucose 4-epimerase